MLQTLGFRPLRVLRLVVIESVVLSLLGGILGVIAGSALLHFGGLSLAAEGVTIAFEPTIDLVGLGVTVSLAVGIVAGIVPGWQAASTKIVTGLRQA